MVDDGQSASFFIFFYLDSRVVSYDSKDSKPRRTSKLDDVLKSYDDFDNVFLCLID